MKKQTSPIIVIGLTLAALLSVGAGLAKAEPHLDLAHQIKATLIHIDVESLLDKYRELTKRVHQISLDMAELEIELETAQGEEERGKVELRFTRTHKMHNYLVHAREQTRDKLQHIADELAHNPREHGEEHHHDEERDRNHEQNDLEQRLHNLEREIGELREAGKHDKAEHLERQAEEIRHHFANREHGGERHHEEQEHQHTKEGFRERLHQLEREIEELREAGKHDHAEQLERQANEIRGHFAQREHGEGRERLEHLQAERRVARQHLEEISERLKSIDGEGEEAQARRLKLEDKHAEVREFLAHVNEQLKELSRDGREHREEKEELDEHQREE